MKNFTEPTSAYYNNFKTPETFRKYKSPSALKTKIMTNRNSSRRNFANDLYDVYSVPQDLHDYKDGYKFTEGIYDLTNYEDCLWLLDLILDQQIDLNPEFQIWYFTRTHQNSFTLVCKNKEGNKIAETENVQANFYFDDVTIIKKDQLFCLPIEEKNY
ncbi:DUF6876 family protein [Chryseobacterium sp. ISL-6]|uniref:DUF6876 family protein n=1 Tax=Chryseobacterium sp. ISL-6 TaxID=2819143 RepID=UPI001BECDEFF|nr:DUF6876 family protein [Chryseobacterium sp. ISL-6]MBT2621583.1 hypothetical protein [Chryseobacterium sp. ISL-6]